VDNIKDKIHRRLTAHHWKSRFLPDKLGRISDRKVLSRLPEYPIIIDAGAHIGIDSIKFAKARPGATIYSLEPVEKIFEQLIKNTAKYPQITPLKIGLSDKSGKAVINVSNGTSDASSSILKPKGHLQDHPTVKFDTEETIEVLSLDSFFEMWDLKRVDLLWMDLQGFEPFVLRASINALSRVKMIHTEVSFTETYEGVELFPSLNSFMTNVGFKLVEVNKDFADMGNALYLNNFSD
jgi:FkbM family methyltransferase